MDQTCFRKNESLACNILISSGTALGPIALNAAVASSRDRRAGGVELRRPGLDGFPLVKEAVRAPSEHQYPGQYANREHRQADEQASLHPATRSSADAVRRWALPLRLALARASRSR